MNLSTVASIEAETQAASLRSVGYGTRRDDLAGIDADIAATVARTEAIGARRQAIASERQANVQALRPKAEAVVAHRAAFERARVAGITVDSQGGQRFTRWKAAEEGLLAAVAAFLDAERRLHAEDAALYAEAVALRDLAAKLDDEAVEARKPFNRRWHGRS